MAAQTTSASEQRDRVSMLDAALEHKRRGLKIFPLALGQKGQPLVKAWQLQATSDEARIREFWTRWPDANIGIHAENLCVIDVDCKGGKDGFASLAALEAQLAAEGGQLDATLETETPSGGRHLFYRLPANATIRNGVNVLGEGLDIRTTGGFVVAAGSKTAAGEYRIVCDEPIADIDPKLLERLLAPAPVPRDTGPVVETDPENAERRAIEYLNSLEPAPEGQRNHLLMLAARKLGDFGVPVERAVAVALEHFQCVGSLSEEEIERTVRSAYNRRQTPVGSRSPEALGFEAIPPEQQTPHAPGPAKFNPSPRTAQSLYQTEFAPLVFTVNNLLPEGVFLLAASPKVGKSWLALQLCFAVASGSQVLGEQATQGDALYLALDGDSDRRLKSRLQTLGMDTLAPEALESMHFETTWPRMNDGGEQALDQWLEAHPRTRLVVVDVLERVRPRRDPTANPYGEDYAALEALKRIAGKRRLSIVVVHHTRKASADDAAQLVSGTQGLTGAADGIIVLQRPRGEEKGTLHLIARDLAKDGDYAVSFRNGQWQMIGPAALVAKTEVQSEIVEALRTNGGPMGVTEIAAAVGKAKSTIHQALRTMGRDGRVRQGADKKYTLPAEAAGYSSPEGAPFPVTRPGDSARLSADAAAPA
jgi:hypothetical protein